MRIRRMLAATIVAGLWLADFAALAHPNDGDWLPQGQAPAAKSSESDLLAQFDRAVQVFMDEYRAADEKTRPALLADPIREPRHRFTPLFLEAAERHRGTPEALAYWSWLIDNGAIVDLKVGERAVERILADHLTDPALAPAAKAVGRAAGLRGADRTIADLTLIVDRSPYPVVRAEALFQRALLRRQAGSKDARADFARAAVEAPDSPAGKRASAELAAFVELKSGAPAPELIGKTLSGEAVNLSGLRGRVVLVDFWGMWCGPCVAQLPRLRTLREQFKGRPFDIIGVNSDKDQEQLRRFMTVNHIDWINVLDQSTEGPVAKAWHIDAWPSNFLVDEQGVIRGRNLDFDALIVHINGLLKQPGRDVRRR